MADVAAKDTGATPPAIVTTLPKTTTTTTDAAAAAASPDGAAAANNRSARRKTARSPNGSTGGHYADPLSPIASTPLKRQRVQQTAEKASKATPSHASSSSVKKTPKSEAPSAAPATDAFLSPRKLVHEYGADEKPACVLLLSVYRSIRRKAFTHSPLCMDARCEDTAAAAHERASPERQTPIDADAPSGDDELFSPVLKPPRATRTSSEPSPTTAFLSSSSTCSELTNDDEDEACAANGAENDEAADANEELDEQEDDAGVGSDSGSDASELEFNPYVSRYERKEDAAMGLTRAAAGSTS